VALLSQPARRGDPLLNHNFVISLLDSHAAFARLDLDVGYFRCRLGGFSEAADWKCRCRSRGEGGNNGRISISTRVTWSNITLKKGVGSGACCGTGTGLPRAKASAVTA
jgi:hypothetical protein